MSYIQGEDRGQAALLPAAVEDYVAADAPVRVAGGRFLTRNLKGTRTEMALSVLAYNMLRVINIKAALA